MGDELLERSRAIELVLDSGEIDPILAAREIEAIRLDIGRIRQLNALIEAERRDSRTAMDTAREAYEAYIAAS